MGDAPILLATDLDRTLLPNGDAPESPDARPRFRRFAAQPEVTLVYVTGRHRELIEQAMVEYDLPMPNYVIGDVGTSLYAIHGDDWHADSCWTQSIMADWSGYSHDAMSAVLSVIPELRLQERTRQGICKLSYYAPALTDPTPLLGKVNAALATAHAKCNLVWSIDETTDTGLLDVLPASASKLHALEFLRRQLAIPLDHTVFAGDSGNDMEVLISEIPSVLVANAQEIVRRQAMDAVQGSGHQAALYLAQGTLAGMNGNYSAGILEGVAHYMSATRTRLEEQ